MWIDHLCIFHDDSARSATWQEQTGVYHCWTEDRTYSLEEVEGALGLLTDVGVSAAPNTPIGAITSGASEPSQPLVVVSETVYEYSWPNGETSHYHIRRDYSDGSKEMPFKTKEGLSGRPQRFHPIYNEKFLAKGQVIFIVEGEKCVDYINLAEDHFGDLPITGLTTGSSSEIKKYSPEIVEKIRSLNPEAVLLWPDNDEPGLAAMKHLKALFDRQRIPVVMLDPLRYNLSRGEDVADYLETGGSLAVVASDSWPQVTTQNTSNGLLKQRMKSLIDATLMINPAQFVYLGTQTPVRLSPENLEAVWRTNYGTMPPANVTKEVRAILIAKGITAPVDVAFRQYAVENCMWWRPVTEEPCYQINSEGITRVSDPPGTMVLVPKNIGRMSPEVDLDGDQNDFRRFCRYFSLDEISEGIVLTWLVSAFTGRKTPILLLKGGAATGKTTLATYLAAIVDPDVPTISAQKVERDVREFVRTAQRHPALLLDNVGTVKPDIEDALSKLVTGEAASLRILYEDVVETIHLQRAIIVTTTTWDVTKGDLASRMWPIEPHLPPASFLDEDDVTATFEPMLPRLRGFVFHMCHQYYRQVKEFSSVRTGLRLGGRVLQTLGYDVAEVDRYITETRSRVIAEGEPWLDALVDLWEEIKETGPFAWSPVDLARYLGDQTGETPSPKILSSYIRPRQALFPNYGFKIDWGRSREKRFYRFLKADSFEKI